MSFVAPVSGCLYWHPFPFLTDDDLFVSFYPFLLCSYSPPRQWRYNRKPERRKAAHDNNFFHDYKFYRTKLLVHQNQ